MGDKLKDAIRMKYRNFAHFGDSIGMHRQQVNRYVNGLNKPHEKTIERFADGLGISKSECAKLFEEKA